MRSQLAVGSVLSLTWLLACGGQVDGVDLALANGGAAATGTSNATGGVATGGGSDRTGGVTSAGGTLASGGSATAVMDCGTDPVTGDACSGPDGVCAANTFCFCIGGMVYCDASGQCGSSPNNGGTCTKSGFCSSNVTCVCENGSIVCATGGTSCGAAPRPGEACVGFFGNCIEDDSCFCFAGFISCTGQPVSGTYGTVYQGIDCGSSPGSGSECTGGVGPCPYSPCYCANGVVLCGE